MLVNDVKCDLADNQAAREAISFDGANGKCQVSFVRIIGSRTRLVDKAENQWFLKLERYG